MRIVRFVSFVREVWKDVMPNNPFEERAMALRRHAHAAALETLPKSKAEIEILDAPRSLLKSADMVLERHRQLQAAGTLAQAGPNRRGRS